MPAPLRWFSWTLVLIVACDNDITSAKMYVSQEPFAIALDATNASRFTLTGVNGDIQVVGVSRSDSVFLVGTREVGSRESQTDATIRLQDLQVHFDQQGDTILVRTIQPANQEGRNYTVNYEITLPEFFVVRLAAANGNIDVFDLANDLTTHIANGNTNLKAIAGSVHALGVNGNVFCEAQLPQSGTLELGATNGEIALAIPTDTSALFEATVANGSIHLVNLTLEDLMSTSTKVTGRLGSGQGSIGLRVGNGTITATGVAP